MLQSTIGSTIVLALTTGPHQPEYTSYEEPGATDMVNLMTGDFTYNIPILDVPGPEGSFSLPLSYHAGIGLDQEASWVGLGWSLNPGAITRNINEFPDDASGEKQSILMQDLVGQRGWEADLLAFGKIGWNNQVGHYGSVSLSSFVNFSYTEDDYTVGIAGVYVGSDKMYVNELELASALVTAFTLGAATPAAMVVTELAKAEAIGFATKTLMAAQARNGGDGTPIAPSLGAWKYSKRTKWGPWHMNYWIYLDQTRTEKMYGTLNLGKVTGFQQLNPPFGYDQNELTINGTTTQQFDHFEFNSTSEGSASDINYDIPGDYFDANSPVNLALDQYNVSGPGVSGGISPYRFDFGTVAVPRQISDNHYRLAPIKYKDYKVPFLYDGMVANAYFHHVGSSSAVTSPTFYNGLSVIPNNNPTNGDPVEYKLTDHIFLENSRVSSDVASFLNSTNKNNRFPSGMHVEWFSNSEIKNATTVPGFTDFMSPDDPNGLIHSDRYRFRSFYKLGIDGSYQTVSVPQMLFSTTIPVGAANMHLFDVGDEVTVELKLVSSPGSAYTPYSTKVTALNAALNQITIESRIEFGPYSGQNTSIRFIVEKTAKAQNQIGGYSVTGMDGRSFHYSLPVFDHSWKAETREVLNPTSKRAIISRSSPFANTWLLTAITGSDFIDRNDNGMVDNSDWGSWIKLNYAKTAEDFPWRIPYEGYKPSAEGVTESMMEGKKQMYYPNSIETRTHIALFLKSNRLDSKSVGKTESSMKLDEIVLLEKEKYMKLIATPSAGGYGLTNINGSIDKICETSEIDANVDARNFINRNCVKRILFTYSYELCKNTPNSDAFENGKLTLTSIAIIGRNNARIAPDFKFEYGNNPQYDADNWDGWGYYNSLGQHTADPNDQSAAAWSLSKIVTPLGSEILVNYERDTYSKISSQWAVKSSFNESTTYNQDSNQPLNYINVSNPNNYSIGDKLVITGTLSNYTCGAPGSSPFPSMDDEVLTVTSKSGSRINLSAPFATAACAPTPSSITVTALLTVKKIGKKGGSLRVSSLSVVNETGFTNKVRYIYDDETGLSTGVISKEPAFVGPQNHSFYSTPGYPAMPVIYGKVSVLTGKLSTDSDYHTRQVYSFETPTEQMVNVSRETIFPRQKTRTLAMLDFNGQQYEKYEYSQADHYKVSNRTSKIGAIKSVEVFDAQGEQTSLTQFAYTGSEEQPNDLLNSQHQGVYTEGLMMFDFVKENTIKSHYKLNRTTTIHYPYTVKSVTTTNRGMSSSSENKVWDFYTGAVLEKVSTSPGGLVTKSVIKPAYTFSEYQTMGPKGFDINNKNMLAQTAASYEFKVDMSGNTSLIGAHFQTWKKDWTNYRSYNSANSEYEDATGPEPVWRKAKNYVWVGNMSKVLDDGTHRFANEYFNPSSTTNVMWKQIGEIERYDYYGMPLDRKDMNNLYATNKNGYNDSRVIAQATNAKYTEIAFSSAEDLYSDKPFFGGEVGLKDGSVKYLSKGEVTSTHTGDAVIELSSGRSFVYKTLLEPGKKYRAAVWSNGDKGRLYYIINGTETESEAPTKSINGWYLSEIEIPSSSSARAIEVGVKCASGSSLILFDDFRFQPWQSSMTCYVDPPSGFEFTTTTANSPYVTYVLNNDNLFTRYEYNTRGILTTTYQESFTYGVRKISESKDNYARFNVNK